MAILAWNFAGPTRLHTLIQAMVETLPTRFVFALRSLLSLWADEILRRFSSSSLPPSFASGRFAGFCFPHHHPTRLGSVRRA